MAMSFLLGMLAALLLLLAVFCEAEGVRLYRIEREWMVLEQQGGLETTHSAL